MIYYSNIFRSLGGELLQCYADQLARDDSIEAWPLRQAMKAVKLYLDVYLPEGNCVGCGARGLEERADGTPAVQKNGGDGVPPPMKDRATVLPIKLTDPLRKHLERAGFAAPVIPGFSGGSGRRA